MGGGRCGWMPTKCSTYKNENEVVVNSVRKNRDQGKKRKRHMLKSEHLGMSPDLEMEASAEDMK